MNTKNITDFYKEEVPSIDRISEIKKIVESHPNCWMTILKGKKNRHLLEFIVNSTPLLSDPFYSLSTKVYWILNGLTDFPRCEECGQKIELKNVTPTMGYHRFCSPKCSASNDGTKAKVLATSMEHHGGIGFASKELSEKSQKTNELLHGSKNYRNVEQAKKTNMSRYGVDIPTKKDEVKQKIRDAWNKKSIEEKRAISEQRSNSYRKTYSSRKKEIVEKRKRTCLVRHGDEGFNNTEKRRETCLERYGVESYSKTEIFKRKCIESCLDHLGVEYPMRSDEVKKKSKTTCLEKYGVEYSFQSNNNKEKSSITKLDRYGDESFTNRSKAEQTCLGLFGTKSPLANEEVKKKCRNTMMERYGVEYSAQSKDIRDKQRHGFHSEEYGIDFDSRSEFILYDFCIKNDISVEYSPNVFFEYEFHGKIHKYFPDFLINGKLYEVKGDHFFRINETTGKEEMYNPFREKAWSDEEYELECEKYEKKHICMVENGIIILKSSDITNESILWETLKND